MYDALFKIVQQLQGVGPGSGPLLRMMPEGSLLQRFDRALYAKLSGAAVAKCLSAAGAASFERSLQKREEGGTVAKYSCISRRALQLASVMPSEFAAATLCVLGEVKWFRCDGSVPDSSQRRQNESPWTTRSASPMAREWRGSMGTAALASGVHPSVRRFAHDVARGEAPNYDGDPLKDFSEPALLEKFAYRSQRPLGLPESHIERGSRKESKVVQIWTSRLRETSQRYAGRP